jgi:hypothetical protein
MTKIAVIIAVVAASAALVTGCGSTTKVVNADNSSSADVSSGSVDVSDVERRVSEWFVTTQRTDNGQSASVQSTDCVVSDTSGSGAATCVVIATNLETGDKGRYKVTIDCSAVGDDCIAESTFISEAR